MQALWTQAEAALARVAGREGVDHVDVRASRTRARRLSTDAPDRMVDTQDAGSGVVVRVVYRGVWGIGCAAESSESAAAGAADTALERARDAARVAGGAGPVQRLVRLAEEEPAVGSYHTPVLEDPFAVAGERVSGDLRAAWQALAGAVQSARATMAWQGTDKVFLSSRGSRLEQRLVLCGASLAVTVASAEGPVTRSWPGTGPDVVAGLAAGYEATTGLGDIASRLRNEVFALARAPLCPARTTALVLDPSQLAVHLGATVAPASLWSDTRGPGLDPAMLGRMTYGSRLVNICADGRLVRGGATAGWDDEGVPARVTPLVARGVFVGAQCSRQGAETWGMGRSSGSMRAPACDRAPVLSGLNLTLAPDPRGPSSLDELIADTRDGILLATGAGASLDPATGRHTFACEIGWRIEGGRRTAMVRAPVYTARSLWQRCDAIAAEPACTLVGLWPALVPGPDGRKHLAAGFAGAPARFHNVDVGSRASSSR